MQSSPEAIQEARRLFALQRERQQAAPHSDARERVARLRRLKEAILRRRAAIATAMHDDFRKSRVEVDLTEIQPVLTEINYAVRHLKRWVRPRRVETPWLLAGTRSAVRYEPKGVVLILSPWNYPFNLLMSPLVAALAAGNRAILRPSEKVPRTSEIMAEVVRDAFEEEVVALVGGEVEVAEALLELPFDHIFFTGSPAVGRIVMRAAAEHLASVTLELGGKSPALVDETADVASAAERIVWGKFINAGQTCVAPDYVLVHESREKEFTHAAVAAVERFYGDTAAARRSSPDFPRLVDDGALRRVSGLLRAAVESGAEVAVGGETDAAERYLAPTVLRGVTWESPIMEEEIFGPVLPVLPYRSLEGALEEVRRRPKPLALYLFAKGEERKERVLRESSAGGTVIGNTVLHLANPALPFGGTGESGQGSYHGWYGFRAFSHERAVMEQRGWNFFRPFYPPYGPTTDRLLGWVARVFG